MDSVSFSANQGDCPTIGTERQAGQTTDTDTYLEVFGATCSTRMACDDDSGPGVFSLISNFTAPYTGAYVARVRHFLATGPGPYRLVLDCNPVPRNPICATALLLPWGTFSFNGSTRSGVDDYTLPEGTGRCTGYSTAGQDVVYRIDAESGARISLDYQSSADGSVYIITDAANPSGSCVAGRDSSLSGGHETLTCQFAAAGTCFLILDSFGTNTGGTCFLTGTLDCPSNPVQPTTWGSIKARYLGR